MTLGATVLAVAPFATAADTTPPRIVGARTVDADGDGKIDRVKLRYSERIRHARDVSGFPFEVSGYAIRRIEAAKGTRTLVILLKEKASSDLSATPAVRYSRTSHQPVRDRAGNQAVKQTFRGTCGLADKPDMRFKDSNCDGIDGDPREAIFVSPLGDDSNPGTKAAPKRTLFQAQNAAVSQNKSVYAMSGIYPEVLHVHSGVSVYGGYDVNWHRSLANVTKLAPPAAAFGGSTYGSLARFVAGQTTLQHLTFQPGAPIVSSSSSFGIVVRSSSGLVLDHVVAIGAKGTNGSTGGPGTDGADGADGSPGGQGSCDGLNGDGGGPAGDRFGREGGEGGAGGTENDSADGEMGQAGAGSGGGPGGPGGSNGDPGVDGGEGNAGDNGSSGGDGGGGAGGVVLDPFWVTDPGDDGVDGTDGFGGGGGGGGGAQVGFSVNNGGGNGGGEGGDGGQGGQGGDGGGGGGGSFGILVSESTVVIRNSSLTAANGGNGGIGGEGGDPGLGGSGGPGGFTCPSEVGEGGDGGPGGFGGGGGDGGGGAGGPSFALFMQNSTVTRSGNTLAFGSGGAGGSGLGFPGSPGAAGATN